MCGVGVDPTAPEFNSQSLNPTNMVLGKKKKKKSRLNMLFNCNIKKKGCILKKKILSLIREPTY